PRRLLLARRRRALGGARPCGRGTPRRRRARLTSQRALRRRFVPLFFQRPAHGAAAGDRRWTGRVSPARVTNRLLSRFGGDAALPPRRGLFPGAARPAPAPREWPPSRGGRAVSF